MLYKPFLPTKKRIASLSKLDRCREKRKILFLFYPTPLSFSPFVTAKGFFTGGEKPTGKERDEPIVEGSTIRLASRDPLSDFSPSVEDKDDSSSQSPSAKEKRRAPPPSRHGRKGAENPLPLTASKRDEPIVEGSTIRLASRDPLSDCVKERRAHRQWVDDSSCFARSQRETSLLSTIHLRFRQSLHLR